MILSEKSATFRDHALGSVDVRGRSGRQVALPRHGACWLNSFGVCGDNHAGLRPMGPSEWVRPPGGSGGRRSALSPPEYPPWKNVGTVAAKSDRAENHVM